MWLRRAPLRSAAPSRSDRCCPPCRADPAVIVPEPVNTAHQAAEAVARTSYGRLLGYLARNAGDITLAEDVLSEAFEAAVRTWPKQGVPTHPVAWLLTTARRRLIGDARRADTRRRAQQGLEVLAKADAAAMAGPSLEDDRLRLMFVCTHPAIDPAIHAPLILQTVFGIDANRMATVFNLPAKALGQRLVRAKQKIAAARIPFLVPASQDFPGRLTSILDAIYAVYTSGWDDPGGSDEKRRGLSQEAIRLGRLVVELIPGEPEACGLLALMLHAEARVDARRDEHGAFVPLASQDTQRWSRELIVEAEAHLSRAAGQQRIGAYQLEAAIQSVHARRALTGVTDWASIATLYDGLVALSPSVGASVARAAAHGEAMGPDTGLALLSGLGIDDVVSYQPYWTVAAHLYARRGNAAAAADSLQRAITLTSDPAIRRHLEGSA